MRHETPTGWWEAEALPVPASLQGYVRRASWYREEGPPLLRRELPGTLLPIVIGTGDPISVTGGAGAGCFGAFLAGLSGTPSVTAHGGRWSGVQVDLTPLGAWRLLGRPLHELVDQVVELRDLDVRPLRTLDRAVLAAPDGVAQVHAALAAVGRAVEEGPSAHPAVAAAWTRLVAGWPVGRVADAVGWSHRHLVARFRTEVGVTPGEAARLARFERAVVLLADRGRTLGEVAADAGYADQSHFHRECRRLASCTPGALRAERNGVRSVQDDGIDACVPSTT